MLLGCLLLGQELCLGLPVLLLIHRAVQEMVHEPFQSERDARDLRSQFGDLDGVPGRFALCEFFEFLRDLVCERFRERNRRQKIRHLCVDQFFANALLRARLTFLGAAKVVVTFVGLRGHAAATLPALENTPIPIRLESRQLAGLPELCDHTLHVVEEPLADNRFVFSLVEFTVENDHAVVGRVLKQTVVLRTGKEFAFACRQSELLTEFDDLVEGVVPARVLLEALSYQGRSLWVLNDSSRGWIVHIPDRRFLRDDAALGPLSMTTLDVFREIVDVVLRLPEHDREHELTLWRGLEPEGRELQLLDDARVDKVDDPPAVEAVSSEPVGMPCENARSLAGFQSSEHLIEDGPARRLGALLLNHDVDDGDLLPAGEFPEFGKLVIDRPHLMIRVVSRLAGVENEVARAHTATLAR